MKTRNFKLSNLIAEKVEKISNDKKISFEDALLFLLYKVVSPSKHLLCRKGVITHSRKAVVN